MTKTHLLVSTTGAITTLTLNRPGKLNSLTPELLHDLGGALDDAGADPRVRCVVITGAGRAFSSGQALGGTTVSTRDVLERYYNPLVTSIVDLPKPVIASINGIAAGAAASLTLACDWRIMADDARYAFLSVPSAELEQATVRLADRLASGPASIGLFKDQLRASATNTLQQQLALEVSTQELATRTDDHREGVAAFLEKRKPRFTGH